MMAECPLATSGSVIVHAIINVLSDICAFHTMTSQNVFVRKSLTETTT